MHQGISYFDIRIRIPFKGDIHNLHLIVVPNFERHTAINTTALIIKFCDNLFRRWREKLIGTTTDGENTMTGRHGGVVTLIEREAEHEILRVWCGAHLGDLAAKAFMNCLDEGLFYKTLHAFSTHLRKQANLITSMRSTCPKDTTRWAASSTMILWLLANRVLLLVRIQDKQPVLHYTVPCIPLA